MDVEDRELKLFEVFLNDEQIARRLQGTKKYAGSDLLNCSNLVLVLLGIVKPEYYLDVCTRRRQTTSATEFDAYVMAAMSQCGIEARVEEKQIPVSRGPVVFKSIRPNYAIPLGIRWKTGGAHSVLLRRNAGGVLECIDPQIFGGFGDAYPFKLTGDFEIQTYLEQNAAGLYLVLSYETIDEATSLSETCMTSQSPMGIEGGRKKRRPRKNGKKTKTSKKHHAVRTRRRRN